MKARAARDKTMQKLSTGANIKLEIKALDSREFDGYGSVFGNVDYGGDIVMPGAFERSLEQHRKSGGRPSMCWMHDMKSIPGAWIDLHEDERGLAVKGVLAKTPLGSEARELVTMKPRALSGLSIGYNTIDHDYDKHGNRLLKEVELWEVSLVSMAMNPMAQVTHAKMRLSEMGEYVPSIREFESALRDIGCSRDVSKHIITKIYEDEQREAVAHNEPDCREGEQDALNAAERVYENILVGRIQSIFKLPV
jgi:HK97 family phage prohead protease